MKRFFVLTFTLLLAITCLLVSNVFAYDWDSDYGDGFAGNAWGSACVMTWFEFPFAESSHGVYLSNNSPAPIRYYYKFEASITGPSEILPKDKGGKGWVAIDDSASHPGDLRFNMRNKREGEYTINASSNLSAKADFNGDGVFDSFHDWDASCSTDFDIE